MPKQIVMCFPLPTDNVGISYIALSIYKEMRKQGYPVTFITPVIRREAFGIGIKQSVPLWLRFLPWRYLQKIAHASYTRAILRLAEQGTVFDLWSDHSPDLIDQIKQRGATVVKEKFNTAQNSAKRILTTEYQRNALPDRCSITDASIQSEARQLSAADYIFSPSPKVMDSLLHEGIDGGKIIPTSFGWDDSSHGRPYAPLVAGYKGPRFLFVGSVEIRKGAHLLLHYWLEAKIEGTLIFLGAVRDEMKPVISGLKLPDNVVFLGHHEKAHGIYNEVDVFVFPSLEEGGPLVTYEAMARGVPVIVSPMGAGAVARAGLDGYVVEPNDRTGWIGALKEMGTNAELRKRFSASASIRATAFTWDKVARQRYSQIQSKFSSHAESRT